VSIVVTPSVRRGQVGPELTRDEFARRFRESFADPSFQSHESALAEVEALAWDAYNAGRKAPLTQPAGAEFEDPGHELSVEWLRTRQRLQQVQARQRHPAAPTQVLLICGSPRNDGSCPGERSKTHRLLDIAQQVLVSQGVEVDVLDLSRITSEYGRTIHPCKGCVSTAMPLCHWPCSCYPNHALNQVDDWMADIYEHWTAAHGVLILTPVHWYQTPSVLKLMIDRLVCADGGNPDPTRTGGKDAARAKALELQGWNYPKHLAGRAYGLVVHGDVAGVLEVRRALSDWLDWMGLIDAGEQARLDRFIGYYEPYATSHEALDRDDAVQDEVRNVALALLHAVAEIRAGRLTAPDKLLARVRPK
jgi:multimeric flavodoxin WrbA